MKLRDRIQLIPRNNWDYGILALFRSLAGMSNHAAKSPNMEKIFQQNPIWTNTGRTSLYAILKSLELPEGAKVGVPLFCCSVVFDAISQAGFIPRFIDSNLQDCNISAGDLRDKQAELSAVIAVHMFGNPCDMESVLAAADGLPVIEDCAQSILSTYHDQQTGLLSTASFFSFRCGKYISAGEGSAIFCRDKELRIKIERIVSSFDGWKSMEMFTHALSTFVKATLYNRPWYGMIGHPVGMRLDKKLNLTAKNGFQTGKIAPTHRTLTEERIHNFQEKIDLQREHAQILTDLLVPFNFNLPSEGEGCSSNWFQFALRFHNTTQRAVMAETLFHHGIDTSKYLDDIVDEARSKYGYHDDCPNAELLSKTVLLIPIHYSLHLSDIEHIAQSIQESSQKIELQEDAKAAQITL